MTDPQPAAREADHRFSKVGEWLAQHADGPVTVLCAEAPEEVRRGRLGVRLDTCLTATPTYRLVDLLLAAGHPLLILRDGCRLPDPTSLTTLAALLTDEHVAVSRVPPAGPVGPLIDVARPPVNRRGLLGLGRTSGKPGHEADDDAGRLLESLRRLGEVNDAVEAPGRALAVSNCTACGLCTRVCPHDALTLEHDSDRSTLFHLPERCQGEQVCVTACPTGGIVDRGPLTWADALTGERRELISVTTSSCVRCGARTAAGDLCEPCAFRRAHPFGWTPPPLPPARGAGSEG